MLETIDPGKKISKEDYKEWFPRLKADLRALQQKVREAGVPVLILVEGVAYAGKADTIRQMADALDPRGFTVHSIDLPTVADEERPWLWRFWVRSPSRGKIALFERYWYIRVLEERVEGRIPADECTYAFQEINQTEEMLADDGAIIIKLWLQVSREEQKKRLKRVAEDPFREFDPRGGSLKAYKKYDEYQTAVEEMLVRTSTHAAPWIIVESDHPRFRRVKVLQSVCETIADALNKRQANEACPEKEKIERVSVPALEEMPKVLDRVDLSLSLTEEEYDSEKTALQAHLRELQFHMVKQRLPMLMVFEGWDAAGKGGSIRRLTANLEPRFYDVYSITKPTPEELARHYLWRFWRRLPRSGHIAIFDRSHYGRVMVERVEGFCSEEAWRRAYHEINEFEMMLYRHGVIIAKFWLEISSEEQLQRFEARSNDETKQHKITDEDWRNRAKWDAYRGAVDEMIQRTSTTFAPWTIVEGNCKRYARVKVMKTVASTMKAALGR
jgi:polyphosphate:AMP phosphotransferase